MRLAAITACCYLKRDPIWRLEKSAKRFKIPLYAFGVGQNDTNWINIKIHKMMDAAREMKERSYTHVLYTDGRDSFFTNSLSECEQKYVALGEPRMLMSAETSPYPYPELGPSFPDPGTPYRYPCAGQFIAEINWLLEKYREMIYRCVSLGENDQGWIMWAYSEGLLGDGFELDTHCSIFQSMANGNEPDSVGPFEREILNGQPVLYNRVTGTYPCVLHFNGGYTDPVAGKDAQMRGWWNALEMNK